MDSNGAWTKPLVNPPASEAIVSNTPKMEVIITGTGGDVTKNHYVKNNIIDSQLTNQLVELAKNGTPMITFGNGSDPKVM
ncbi:MAG: hypothetical protein ACXVHS_10410, partial [Methanobacterium sp.]